jgi:hypothetical protein
VALEGSPPEPPQGVMWGLFSLVEKVRTKLPPCGKTWSSRSIPMNFLSYNLFLWKGLQVIMSRSIPMNFSSYNLFLWKGFQVIIFAVYIK